MDIHMFYGGIIPILWISYYGIIHGYWDNPTIVYNNITNTMGLYQCSTHGSPSYIRRDSSEFSRQDSRRQAAKAAMEAKRAEQGAAVAAVARFGSVTLWLCQNSY
jgi:hypothetical protein